MYWSYKWKMFYSNFLDNSNCSGLFLLFTLPLSSNKDLNLFGGDIAELNFDSLQIEYKNNFQMIAPKNSMSNNRVVKYPKPGDLIFTLNSRT